MTEPELRALVRDAIARQAGRTPAASAAWAPASVLMRHASHGMFVLQAGADQDGPCVIEPAVSCDHCGYCKSYGH